ncbi:MAG: hypothetical protein QG657_628 [Acidobacteriota bacterium]|nr:hypothetical protein [Acidobacteriota bacterium]
MKHNILILFSGSDEQWKARLEKQLDVPVKAGGYKIDIDSWNEKQTESHGDWFPDLDAALNRADLILLLVSDNFLNSPIMQSDKVKERFREKQNGGFPIFLILLYRCGWRRYSWMRTLPQWPGSGKYLSDLGDSAVKKILSDVALQIVEKLELTSKITEGILAFLGLAEVGPVKDLSFEPGRRLNIITGNNGYGKTFLMECIWWALAGVWPNKPILPKTGHKENEAKINFQLTSKSGSKGNIETITYDDKKEEWPRTGESINTSGLVIYARIDGSFTVWDPVRGEIKPPGGFSQKESPQIFNHPDTVLNGLKEKSGAGERSLCNGLVADWVNWQNINKEPFILLKKILETFSCSEQEPLTPVPPVRIPGDSRPIPALKYPYGNVPIVQVASSVRRMVSLAYLIINTWDEHKRACEGKCDTYKNMVVMIDELECHLHPQWQRTIVPSLLELSANLDQELDIQFLLTTHSPLVLASLEPKFNEETDKIFHLELKREDIVLTEHPFLTLGLVDYWYTSDIFGLSQARSLEAEKAVMKAEEIQEREHPTKEEVLEVNRLLARYLSDFDTYWPHWIYFVKQTIGEKQ